MSLSTVVSVEANCCSNYEFKKHIALTVTAVTWTQRSPVGPILDDVRSGSLISGQQACHLIRVSDEELPPLLGAALEAKQRFKPHVITYSRNVFIPLTNLCRHYCRYCIFRRDPGPPGAATMTPGIAI